MNVKVNRLTRLKRVFLLVWERDQHRQSARRESTIPARELAPPQDSFFFAVHRSGFSRICWTPKSIRTEALLMNFSILPFSIRKLKKLKKKIGFLIDVIGFHSVNPTEVNQRLSYGELTIQGNFLWHVTDSWTWNAWAFRSWPSS